MYSKATLSLQPDPVKSITQQTTEDFNLLSRKCNLDFLYIGLNKDTTWFLASFCKKSIYAESFEIAKIRIAEAILNKKIPDVIIVDLPYHESQLQAFCGFLKIHDVIKSAVVIYSDRDLSLTRLADLKQNANIDDVLNINDWAVNYAAKLSFLVKFKQQQNSLKIHSPSKLFVPEPPGNSSFFVKRCFDIISAAIMLIMLSPIFLLIAFAIKIESKGPVFYTSLRAGRFFKIFPFFKFRTMQVDADKNIDELWQMNQYNTAETGPMFLKICNDPRVTKVGKFLRNTSLDELPQLFNVLRGDMSIVGNRPLPLYEASTLTTDTALERFTAPAGITGLWQVKKRSAHNMSVEERIDLDITYARKYNFLFDLNIILQTPAALFQKASV
jgi:lipopolysaccharide/colanic/teichoic acid biosynthesis glycosyltransferase